MIVPSTTGQDSSGMSFLNQAKVRIRTYQEGFEIEIRKQTAKAL